MSHDSRSKNMLGPAPARAGIIWDRRSGGQQKRPGFPVRETCQVPAFGWWRDALTERRGTACYECATCGEKFWEDDLESTDVPWFDQPAAALLCKDCFAESEESQEINESFDDGATKRACPS